MQNTDDTEPLDMIIVTEESPQEALLDEAEDNPHYYHERCHAFGYYLHVVPIITVSIFVLLAEFALLYLSRDSTKMGVIATFFTLCALILLAFCYFLFLRERWKYQNWTLELNPALNAITLYRHGNRKLFIPERNARTIPIISSAVTKNEQSLLEQYVFTTSSTVSLDNDIQGDEMFHDMKFVRDGYRLREAIIWYNNLHRREERAELEILVEIRDLLKVLTEHFCPDVSTT